MLITTPDVNLNNEMKTDLLNINSRKIYFMVESAHEKSITYRKHKDYNNNFNIIKNQINQELIIIIRLLLNIFLHYYQNIFTNKEYYIGIEYKICSEEWDLFFVGIM